MKLSSIGSETLPVYRSLLVPETFELLREGTLQVALGLVEGETACGALAGYTDSNAFRITSLFVAPGYRGKGGGRMLVEGLLDALPPTVSEVGVSYANTAPEHEGLWDFLACMGFRRVPAQSPVYRVALGELPQSAFFRGGEGGGSALAFRQIPGHAVKAAGQRLAATGELPFEKPLHLLELDADLSMGLLRDGELVSFLVFDHSFGGALTLAYAYASAAADLPVLLRAAFRRAVELYPPDEAVFIQSVTPASDRLISALLDNPPPVSVCGVLPAPNFAGI